MSKHVALFNRQGLALVSGACKVHVDKCEFPFEFGGQNFGHCIPRDEVGGAYACRTNESDWALCNGGCFDTDGVTPIRFGDIAPEVRGVKEIFCKTKPSRCIFPFTFNEMTYERCAEPDEDTPFYWCATAVNDDGFMIDGFRGKCDMDTCLSEGKEPVVESKAAGLSVEQNGVKIDLTFEQSHSDAPLRIRGRISGLVPGDHGFHVHSLVVEEGGDCDLTGGHYNPKNANHGSLTSTEHHVGDLGNVFADENGDAEVELSVSHASLFDDPDPERNIVGKSIVVHAGKDDLGLGGDAGSLAAGNSGPRLACGVIVESDSGWNLMLIIIIGVIVLIVVLLCLILCLVYCCCCRE